MTPPEPGPPLDRAVPRVSAVADVADGVPAVSIDDHLEARVRLPADALRCIVECVEIALLVGLGLLARATVSGVETNVVGASQLADKKLLSGVLTLLGDLAFIALLILALGLAVRLLIRRQPRRLAEAAGAGAVAVVAVAIANMLLRQPAAAPLYDALTLSAPHAPHAGVLDWYLAGLAAYITVVGLSGRRRWRSAYWVALGFYVLASLANAKSTHETLLSLLITLLIGSAIGSGMRYAFGSSSDRPTAAEIAAALTAVDAPVSAIRRIWDTRTETRRYAVTIRGGARRDVTVFDRDQQAADALYRLYRRVRLKTQVSRSGPLTVERAVERRALLTYAVGDAGVATPRLCALIRVGPEASVMANEHHDGTTLAEQDGAATDEQLRRVWDVVLQLHQHRVTHRNLTADRILFASASGGGSAGNGEVVLLEPGDGDVAASDLQVRLDLVQLLAELALMVGPERAADVAAQKLSSAELAAMVPLLQPVALHRTTRMAVRRHRDVLPALRKRLLATTPDGEVAPVQLERVRPRTLITLVAGVVAAYIVIAQFTKVSIGAVLKHADWRWGILVVALSVLTYVGATFGLTGFVLERLNVVRTFLAQLAGSFVTLVTPAAVGGVALNIRYLRKADVSAPDAAASVGVSQVVAFGLHMLLLVIFAALTRTSRESPLRAPPTWVWIALAVLAAAVLVALAIPAGRRLLRSRLAPTLSQLIPRLLDVAQRPGKLAEGIGGAFLLTAAYIFCLEASVLALGGSVPLASVAVVYLTGSAIGSAVPTPGGIGAVEAALSAGLTAAGMPGAKAVSAVLLFRLVTFWLPVPIGWAAMNYLQRQEAL
ncbi:MAG TPA: lysylphosphatidylglycerol synthase transmembrane domain-containing protein [Streptosporangiaceae bacterium]|nr:lysylphosphatidylglycerol synthase transmembrane domain-containing protein [Streptosporangiaceae bacterium]